MQIRGLSLEGCLYNVDLDIHQGEIVGLAGLIGSGRREMLEAIYGLRRLNSGTILLSGAPFKNKNPRVAIKHGVGLVPPDRKTQGVVLAMAVRDNLAMAATSERWRLASPRGGTIEDECSATSRLLSIKATLGSEVRTLSGGNQQKVVLGKWLLRPLKVLLLDEPTRGVDVSAKGRDSRSSEGRGLQGYRNAGEFVGI